MIGIRECANSIYFVWIAGVLILTSVLFQNASNAGICIPTDISLEFIEDLLNTEIDEPIDHEPLVPELTEEEKEVIIDIINDIVPDLIPTDDMSDNNEEEESQEEKPNTDSDNEDEDTNEAGNNDDGNDNEDNNPGTGGKGRATDNQGREGDIDVDIDMPEGPFDIPGQPGHPGPVGLPGWN